MRPLRWTPLFCLFVLNGLDWCIDIKRVMFLLCSIHWWRELSQEAQFGSLLPREVYVYFLPRHDVTWHVAVNFWAHWSSMRFESLRECVHEAFCYVGICGSPCTWFFLNSSECLNLPSDGHWLCLKILLSMVMPLLPQDQGGLYSWDVMWLRLWVWKKGVRGPKKWFINCQLLSQLFIDEERSWM